MTTSAKAVLLAFFACSAALAQEAIPPSQAPGTPEGTPAQRPVSRESRDVFPDLNLYLPEGEANLQVRKLIKNVLFESQIQYNFVDGDVSTFLRYKYYARDFTYKIGVFDEISFDSIELESSIGEFDRVRGGLLQFEYPQDYNNRYFLQFQVDGLSFGDPDRPENNLTNVYTKFGYQFGTPFDERLNRIVGEARGRNVPLLTAYRDIGPQKHGVAFGLTYALPEAIGGDFDYLKAEIEGLKRFDFRNTQFVISRLHIGSMLDKSEVEAFNPERPDYERFTVPRYELFKLGGRDALKGVRDTRSRGTDEIHLSNEYFVPVFRNEERKFLRATFTNLFGVVYLGAGTVGLDSSVFTEIGDYVFDGGLGFETSLRVRDYDVLLSAIYARTLQAPAALEGDEIRLSVRTSR